MSFIQQTQTATTYDRWLAKCLNNRHTAGSYRSAVASFLHSVYGEDDVPPARYLAEVKAGTRNHFDDLVDYVDAANGRTPPNSVSTTLAGVKSFMTWCSDVELTSRQRDMLKSKRGRGAKESRTEKELLDRSKLRTLLGHADPKMKALVLVLLSSGLRIGEALQLRMSDLRLNQYPVAIHVRAETTKTRHFRVTFMSTEAKEALSEWLKVKEGYMAESAYRARNLSVAEVKGPAPRTEDLVFPFSYTTINRAFVKMLEQAQMLNRTEITAKPTRGSNRKTITEHGMRRYFATQAKLKISPALVEFLMGHAGPEAGAYDGWTETQLASEYRKAEPALLVNVKAESVDGMENLEGVNQTLREQLETMSARMEKMESFFQKTLMTAPSNATAARIEEADFEEARQNVPLGPD